jgi:hypothetical protein
MATGSSRADRALVSPDQARNPYRSFVAPTVFRYLQNMLRARGTTASAKLRMVDGEETAAMVYDKQQIVDYYRRIDDHEIAGMM